MSRTSLVESMTGRRRGRPLDPSWGRGQNLGQGDCQESNREWWGPWRPRRHHPYDNFEAEVQNHNASEAAAGLGTSRGPVAAPALRFAMNLGPHSSDSDSDEGEHFDETTRLTFSFKSSPSETKEALRYFLFVTRKEREAKKLVRWEELSVTKDWELRLLPCKIRVYFLYGTIAAETRLHQDHHYPWPGSCIEMALLQAKHHCFP